jgi:hypothetical protein
MIFCAFSVSSSLTLPHFSSIFRLSQPADELHRKLNVSFVGEDGVDAGGLSREFFAILAKEMFNPNYALFMSTEDGCTFQPNPNSSINPDDLRYFKFVGRIVGKAVIDGYLLDAHFVSLSYEIVSYGKKGLFRIKLRDFFIICSLFLLHLIRLRHDIRCTDEESL